MAWEREATSRSRRPSEAALISTTYRCLPRLIRASACRRPTSGSAMTFQPAASADARNSPPSSNGAAAGRIAGFAIVDTPAADILAVLINMAMLLLEDRKSRRDRGWCQTIKAVRSHRRWCRLSLDRPGLGPLLVRHAARQAHVRAGVHILRPQSRSFPVIVIGNHRGDGDDGFVDQCGFVRVPSARPDPDGQSAAQRDAQVRRQLRAPSNRVPRRRAGRRASW